MAAISKKDKLIEDAQKLVARGQFDKAANIYEQLLALEPTAINLRQKLAELLFKCGRNEDARKELETIGKHFSTNGFFLKAIAVYKQLQKYFPSDISLSLTLAELNEKHGLVANALSEYKIVYEFHEKAGNNDEALNVLDRMEHVDSQNVPIKIKLAEAYIQNRKKNEAYALFAKSASLLLERGENAVLSKVFARIQQLFPDKPDFMLEILDEQIRQGNAASAIVSIQSLLRNNPNNKNIWDLVIRAYQQLKQHQKIKVAYQHYLKYFPSEPEAMIGLILSVTAEQNLAEALALLDKYEESLVSTSFLLQLDQVYRTLYKLDPINVRILEGFIRVVAAGGNESELRSLTSKLDSLRPLAIAVKGGAAAAESADVVSAAEPLNVPIAEVSPFSVQSLPEQTKISAPPLKKASFTVSAPDSKPVSVATETFKQPEEEEVEEIEIEIDLDSPFGFPDKEVETASAHDNWLDSVGDLFDSISTAPRVVKFGNEMENSDAQSHFDLGQAFKEMGLYDEAINEFRQASHDPSRLVECLIMQCICLRERGEVEKAITMLQALLKPGLGEEENCAVRYELASAYEAAGNVEEASRLLNEISATNPGFRDISTRINAVTLSESLDFSDEELKNF